jgi:hypothetical protein
VWKICTARFSLAFKPFLTVALRGHGHWIDFTFGMYGECLIRAAAGTRTVPSFSKSVQIFIAFSAKLGWLDKVSGLFLLVIFNHK